MYRHNHVQQKSLHKAQLYLSQTSVRYASGVEPRQRNKRKTENTLPNPFQPAAAAANPIKNEMEAKQHSPRNPSNPHIPPNTAITLEINDTPRHTTQTAPPRTGNFPIQSPRTQPTSRGSHCRTCSRGIRERRNNGGGDLSCFSKQEGHSPRRHLAVHPAVVDEVPVQAVEGAAGDGKAVGGFVVDVFWDVCQ